MSPVLHNRASLKDESLNEVGELSYKQDIRSRF